MLGKLDLAFSSFFLIMDEWIFSCCSDCENCARSSCLALRFAAQNGPSTSLTSATLLKLYGNYYPQVSPLKLRLSSHCHQSKDASCQPCWAFLGLVAVTIIYFIRLFMNSFELVDWFEP